MKRMYILLVVVMLVGLRGCTPEPYHRVKGPIHSSVSAVRPTFDASGVWLGITGISCHVTVVEHWCPLSNPKCTPDPIVVDPIVVKEESTACSRDVEPSRVSLRTPWQQAYPAKFADGVLGVKIDWSATDIDSIDLETLRTDWQVQSEDGAADMVRMALTDDELHALFVAVRKATGNDYSLGPADEHATLTADVLHEQGVDDTNHVVVSVTNRGPAPAYRVVARLQSKAKQLQGIKLSFGRIDPAETKKRVKMVAITSDVAKSEPTLEVEVTSSNTPPVSASNTIRAKAKHVVIMPPGLSCGSSDKQILPGQRIRVECEASNTGETPMHGGTCELVIGQGAPQTAQCPLDLPQHDKRSFELERTVPLDAKPGRLMVSVTMTEPDQPPVTQEIALEVLEPRQLCKQGELTIEGFRKQQARLRELLTAGRITKEEFNEYLAEWWSCVRQH